MFGMSANNTILKIIINNQSVKVSFRLQYSLRTYPSTLIKPEKTLNSSFYKYCLPANNV